MTEEVSHAGRSSTIGGLHRDGVDCPVVKVEGSAIASNTEQQHYSTGLAFLRLGEVIASIATLVPVSAKEVNPFIWEERLKPSVISPTRCPPKEEEVGNNVTYPPKKRNN